MKSQDDNSLINEVEKKIGRELSKEEKKDVIENRKKFDNKEEYMNYLIGVYLFLENKTYQEKIEEFKSTDEEGVDLDSDGIDDI